MQMSRMSHNDGLTPLVSDSCCDKRDAIHMVTARMVYRSYTGQADCERVITQNKQQSVCNLNDGKFSSPLHIYLL